MYPNDYWRIRNITLGYNIGSIAKLPVVSGARIFVTAENWFGGDKYDGGWNPESINTNGGGGEYGGDDYGAAPLPRSVIFGINLNF